MPVASSVALYGSIQKAVYVAALVAASKQVVELPHGQVTAKTAKVLIINVGFSHTVYLCISKQHSGGQPSDSLVASTDKVAFFQVTGRIDVLSYWYCQVSASDVCAWQGRTC